MKHIIATILLIAAITSTPYLECSMYYARTLQHLRAHKYVYGGLAIASSFIATHSLPKITGFFQKTVSPKPSEIESYTDPLRTLEDGRYIVPTHYVSLRRGGVTASDAKELVRTALVFKTRKGNLLKFESAHQNPSGKNWYAWRLKNPDAPTDELVLEGWRKYNPITRGYENSEVRVLLPFKHKHCDISVSRSWIYNGSVLESRITIEAAHRQVPDFKSYIHLTTTGDSIDVYLDDPHQPLPKKLHQLTAWLFYQDSFNVRSDKEIRSIQDPRF